MNELVPRITSIVLVLALLGGALAQDPGEAAGADADERGPSMADVIRETPELGTLADLLEESGMLVQLEDRERITFFAPSDRAFARIGEHDLERLFRNRGAVDVVLRHHVVRGAVPVEALDGLDGLTTVEGTRLAIRARGDRVLVEGVPIRDSVPAGSGMIYVIDRLLLPEASMLVKDLLGYRSH